jgi:hypothetical protein
LTPVRFNVHPGQARGRLGEEQEDHHYVE